MDIFKPVLSVVKRSSIIPVMLIIIPIFLALCYIFTYGVNVVFWDQWELVPLIDDMLQGNLHFDQLFSQHNEHRIFFPRIAMLAIAYLTQYNNLAEMIVGWGILLLSFSLLFFIFREKNKNSKNYLLFFIPVAWLFFSTKQWENLLWGWQIQIFLCSLGFFMMVYGLEKMEKFDRYFFLALFGGFIASFSFFNGLLVWIAGAFYLLITRKNNTVLPAWILSSIVVYAVFFFHWIRPMGHPSPLFFSEHLRDTLVYFIANVGSGLSGWFGNTPTSIVTGITACIMGGFVLLAIFFGFRYDFQYKWIDKHAVWWTFVFFSLATSLMLALGRGGFGVAQSLSSRYVSFTIIGIIGIYCIFLHMYLQPGKKLLRYMFFGLLLIILAGIILGNLEGINAGKMNHDQREEMAFILLQYPNEPDHKLQLLYPNEEKVRELAPILERIGYNVFYFKNT